MLAAGFLAGVTLTTLTARWVVRRSLAKVRAAERRARSAERLAEVGAMTGGLAHEIKNPLSTIGLNAQLLMEGIEDLPTDRPVVADERGRLTRRLASLRREVERLRGILQDFLEFAGELRLDIKPADLNQLVEELIDFLHPQAERQGVRLRSELVEGSFEAPLDAPHMKQAVLNLMLNAIQAMGDPKDAGGRPRELILRTERGVDAEKQAVAALHVIDTGPGIDADTMPRLFRPYFTTKSGGTGLGLPTTRRIVEAHGGRIDVHTEVGRGTDFEIRIPLRRS